MKKYLTIFLLVLVFVASILSGTAAQAYQRGYNRRIVSVTTTTIVLDSYEFGPGVSKVVLTTNSSLRDLDWSSATVTTAGVGRQVSKAYLSDAQGNAVSNGTSSYVTLELAVTYNPDDPSLSASPFSFNLATYRNTWVDSYLVKVENLRVRAVGSYNQQTLSSEQEAINNRLTPSADRFSERGVVGSQQYAAYQPQAATSTSGIPLIVWLHGIGEVGTDMNFPLLSSEVASLTKDEIQSYFTSRDGRQTGAFVLAVQSPVAWSSANTSDLMATINAYVASHPAIDQNRIYLAGASNGGGMVVNMGIAYPNTFAALVPIAASYPYQESYDAATDVFTYTLEDSVYKALAKQPMWLIHARADASIPVDNSVLPFYKAMIDRGADNKWISYYETATGTDIPGMVYNGHWSWIYFFNNQVTGVQNRDNTASNKALWGLVATDPTNGGDSQAIVNGVTYNNIFSWLNAQSK